VGDTGIGEGDKEGGVGGLSGELGGEERSEDVGELGGDTNVRRMVMSSKTSGILREGCEVGEVALSALSEPSLLSWGA
jgi:hypothetical protein